MESEKERNKPHFFSKEDNKAVGWLIIIKEYWEETTTYQQCSEIFFFFCVSTGVPAATWAIGAAPRMFRDSWTALINEDLSIHKNIPQQF